MNMNILQIIQLDAYVRGIEDPPKAPRTPDANGYLHFDLDDEDATLLVHPVEGTCLLECYSPLSGPRLLDEIETTKYLVPLFSRLYALAKADGEKRTKEHLAAIHKVAVDAVIAAGRA